MTATLSVGTFACGPRRPALVPLPDPAAIAEVLRTGHQPSSPRLVIFRWRYYGPEGNFGGEGALRLDPAGRARVDLLGPQAATVEIAILRGDTLWLASGDGEVRLPPPTFLWAMAGVFRPPAPVPDRALGGDGETALEYDLAPRGESVRFEFGPDGRLRRVVRRGDRRAHQELSLRWPDRPADTPEFAEFRDRREFRRIRLEVTESREHAPFEAHLFGRERP